jgi:Alcohol dehydrogenase GroES-like domain
MTTMRAIVLDAPGPPDALKIRELPVPEPTDGWVLIAVKAFGLNRSELHTRLGLAEGVTFPRVLGIEATGVVAKCPGGEFTVGQQVAAMVGGMGRVFDGGYAEYTCVPASQVIAFSSDLDWATLGAVPEMLQTSYGSLTIGLGAAPGQSILIRGGTSSIGMATAVLAKQRDMTVFSTTRNPDKATALTACRRRPCTHRRRCRSTQGPRHRPWRRRHRTRACRDANTSQYAARNAGAWCGLLRRHAVQPVDRPRLLSHRLHPARRTAHLLRWRRHRSTSTSAAGIPRSRFRRRRCCPDRPRLLIRPDRGGAHGHGSRPCERETGDHHITD